MTHFYESVLIDTIDGFQFKSYSNEHPEGFILAKPKYVPGDSLQADGLKYRFLFTKRVIRFNLFAEKQKLISLVSQFREKFPHYVYYSESHKNWFFAVPKDKVKTIYDPKEGLKELLKVPKSDLDDYLKLVV